MSLKGWYQLAKVGTFTDRFGKTYTITRQIIELAASAYKPEVSLAPITIGHIETGREPAWGKVAALKAVGDVLYFKPARLVAEFAKAVNEGLYSKVSAGFELPGWKLTHVAFLGAQPPAIEGLEEITNLEFASKSDNCIAVDFSSAATDWIGGKVEFSGDREYWIIGQLRTIGRIMSRILDKEIEKSGTDAVDKIASQWDREQLMSSPPEDITESTAVSFSKSTQSQEDDVDLKELQAQVEKLSGQVTEFSKQVTTLQGQVTTLQTENATLKTENDSLKINLRKQEYADFCQKLVDDGKLLPDQVSGTIALMESFDSKAKVEFSAGGKTESITALEAFKRKLQDAPKLVEFGTRMTKRTMGDGQDTDQYVKEGQAIAATLKK